MSRPTDFPRSELAESVGPAATAAPHERLSLDDLTWREVAEAIYLMAVARPETDSGPPTDPPTSPDDDHVTPERGDPEPQRSPEEPDRREDEVRPANTTRAEHDSAPAEREPTGRGRLPPSELETGDFAGVTGASGWALPDRLGITRALRPLKRYVTSRRVGDVVIDEIATAERAVQDELWWPVTKPRRERWLDLTVVVDIAPTMAFWRRKVAGFLDVLEQLGAFRMIKVRRLDTHRFAAGVPTAPVLCGPAGPRNPAEVVDRSGRSVALVITDGLGEAWRSDLIGPVLAHWGRVAPVTVVHLLPQWSWGHHGLALHRATVSVGGELRPNRVWDVELLEAWLAREPERAFPESAISIPVVECGPRWMRWWSDLLTGEHHAPMGATVLLAGDKPSPRVNVYEDRQDTSPRERIAKFRAASSSNAQRLAELLAALPVDLSVMRQVQEAYLPGTGPELMAEIAAHGLLRYASRTVTTGSTVDSRVFDIPASDREVLLEGARRSETAGVVRTAAYHHGHRIGALALLRDAIADPDHTPEPTKQADRALQRVVLRALSGGPYLLRAERLTVVEAPEAPTAAAGDVSAVHHPPPSTDGGHAESSERVDTMSYAAERTERASAPTEVSVTSEEVASERAPVAMPPATTTFHQGIGRRQPGDPPPVWGNVPPRNFNFTGRDDLIAQVREQLVAGGTTVVLPAALHGMGGIGKTQTAVEYIYRHLDDYDLVWWIAAGQATQVRSGLTELAKHLGLPGGTEAHTAVNAVLEALRRGNPVRRWLLVFDAAESPESVRKFFPSNGPGEILVTSRNPAWANVARPLEVSVFRREESKELLRRRGPDIDDSDADQIAEKLGDLPLAIEQAAAWRAETGMPVQEYLRLFEEKVAEIFETTPSSDYEVSLAAAWNVSFDELRHRNPAAHQILLICGFFSPEPISRDLFSGVRGVSISPELDVALRDPIQLARAIREINRYGLAKIDHGTNTIQLHRLVQLVLRNRIATPVLQEQMRHGAHQLLANLDPNEPEAAKNTARYLDLLPHAYAADVVNCTDAWVRQLVINLMRFLYQWGDHEEAAGLAQRAYADFTRKLGPNDPQTLEVAWRFGFYLYTLGRYAEAAELNKLTLDRRIQVSGENSEETFGVQRNILADLMADGDFAAAKRLSEDILLKTNKMLGSDDPEALQAAYLHAMSLRMIGDISGARKLDEETYRKRIELLGHDHVQTQSSYVSIVVNRRDAGECAWARIEMEKLVERAIEKFGRDRQVTQMRLYFLSIARRKDGDHRGALELSGPVLDNFRARYGSDHPHTVGCVLAHSIDLRHAGDLAEAQRLGEEALDSYSRLLGEQHPYTSAAMVDLAVTLRLNGNPAGARSLDAQALEQLRSNLGADHPIAVVGGINLVSDLAAIGDTDAAVTLGQEMVDRSRRALGPDHPTTLAAELNLVFDLRAQGHGDTDTRFSDVMTRYRRILGEQHPATIMAARGDRANCDVDPLIF